MTGIVYQLVYAEINAGHGVPDKLPWLKTRGSLCKKYLDLRNYDPRKKLS